MQWSWTAIVERALSISVFADVALKATALLLLATAAAYFLRSSSAAVRHRIWGLTFCGLLVLPFLSAALPAWRIPVLPPSAVAEPPAPLAPATEGPATPVEPQISVIEFPADSGLPGSTVLEERPFDQLPITGVPSQATLEFDLREPVVSTEEPTEIEINSEVEGSGTSGAWYTGPLPFLIAWITGFVLCALPLFIGIVRNLVLRITSSPLRESNWVALLSEMCRRVRLDRDVKLLETSRPLIPMTWGVFRATILLPRESRAWDQRLRRFVLLHELSHVKRRDVLFQVLGRMATAVYWFHPLAWYALRRLRIERELACDDCVLATGEKASEYAAELLKIARGYRPVRLGASVAMAQSANLEDRVRSLFDRARSHVPLNWTTAAILLVATASLVTCIAIVKPVERANAAVDVDEKEPGAESEQSDESPLADAGEPAAASPTSDQAATEPDSIPVTGRVLDRDGKPVAGARVSIVGRLNDVHADPEILVQTESSKDGSFSVEIPRTNSGSHLFAIVFAGSPGFGTGRTELNLNAESIAVDVELLPENVVRGRLIDLEGRAVAGVKVHVSHASKPGLRDNPLWKDYFLDPVPDFTAWPAPATTDQDGRFELRGLGAELKFGLQVRDEPFARQIFWIENDPSKDVQNHQFALAPAQIIEGTVVSDKTGEAIPHARLSAFVGFGPNAGAWRGTGIFDSADANGKFRLNPYPGGSYYVTAFAPSGRSELNKQQEFDWPTGESLHKTELRLPQGVLVRGKLTDTVTGHPIASANIEYQRRNRRNPMFKGVVTGWQARVKSDAEGVFQIAAVPGPGHLLINGPTPDYIAQEIGENMIYSGQPGGQRNYAHAIVEVDPKEGEQTHDVAAKLTRGLTLKGKVVGPDGQPIKQAQMLWRHGYTNSEHEFRGLGTVVRDGAFELHGLAPGQKYHVVFLDAANKLGATVELTANSDSPELVEVKLLPCGSGTVKLVHADGKPAADVFPQLNIVITPGRAAHVNEPSAEPLLAADEDFVSNFDRKNYWGVTTDDQGQLNLPALIPGANYRFIVARGDHRVPLDTFQVKSGEIKDLGVIRIDGPREAESTTSDSTATATQTQAVTQAAAKDEEKSSDDQQTPESQTETASAPFRFAGRVVDPDAKPIVGAEIFFYSGWTTAQSHSMAKSQDDGKFEFAVKAASPLYAQLVEGNGFFVALADGHGLAMKSAHECDSNGALREKLQQTGAVDRAMRRLLNMPAVFQLVRDDQPLVGRVIDIEGHPVAGATIRVSQISNLTNNSLKEWQQAAAAPNADFYSARRTLGAGVGSDVGGDVLGFIAPVTTDQQGQFTLRGIGSNRIVKLLISGPGVETSEVYARTAAGDVVTLVKERRDPSLGKYVYHPATFTHVTGPSQPIVGTVIDSKTKQPLANVTIQSFQIAGQKTSGWTRGLMRATTDADGRYRLEGLPLGKNQVLALSAIDEPYIVSKHAATTKIDTAPLQLDIELTRGLWIHGRAYDKSDNAPIRSGRVDYFAFTDNPHAKQVKGFNGAHLSTRYYLKADGTYRIPGLPGRGVVTIMAERDHQKYRRGVGVETIDGEPEGGLYNTYPYNLTAFNAHILTGVNPAEDAGTVEVDFAFDSGRKLQIAVVDSDGKAVAGCEYTGKMEFNSWQSATENQLEIFGYKPEESRRVQVVHRTLNLAGFLLLKGEQPDNLTITVQPASEIKGRILDASGAPRAGIEITDIYDESRSDAEIAMLPSTPGWQMAKILTDADGRFHVAGMMPGRKFGLSLTEARNEGSYRLGLIRPEVVLKSGEVHDLGDIQVDGEGNVTRLSGDTQPAPAANERSDQGKEKEAATSSTETARKTYSGHVTNPDGSPAGGVKIYLTTRDAIDRMADVLHEVGQSDAQGKFAFELSESLSKAVDVDIPRGWATLIAKSANNSLDWMPLQMFADTPQPSAERDVLQQAVDRVLGSGRFAARSFVLPTLERPIRGRLIDLEGRPLAGVQVVVDELKWPEMGILTKALNDQSKQLVYDAYNAKRIPGIAIPSNVLRKLIPPATTNSEGTFALSGLARDQIATLCLQHDRVAAEHIYVVGRDMETVRIPYFPGNTGGPKDVYAGYDFTHVPAPAVPVEGIVKDYDTGAGVPNAVVSVDQLFQRDDSQRRGSLTHIRAISDDAGRFRLVGIPPGEGHLLTVLPPLTEPYLVFNHELSINPQDTKTDVEIRLKKTFWIEGQVTDKATGEPIQGAVNYLALQKNPNRLDKLGLKVGWEFHRQRIDANGFYRVPALPGPGLVLVTELSGKGYPRGVGAESVDGYDPRGPYIPTYPIGLPVSNWNLIKQVDPPIDAKSFHCDLALEKDPSIPGRIVTPDGKPASDFEAYGEVVNIHFWRPRANGAFSVESYDGKGPRQLFFKTPDESLVAQVRVEGQAPPELVVALQPAVRVTGVLIDVETDLPAQRFELKCKSTTVGEFRIERCYTDDDGRFEVKGLVPGVVYEMYALNEQFFNKERNDFKIDLTKARPGDVIDLGDVTREKREAAKKKDSATKDSTTADAKPAMKAPAGTAPIADPQPTIVKGIVVDPSGKPLSGVPLFRYTGPKKRPAQRTESYPERLGETDATGRFSVRLTQNSRHNSAIQLIAAPPGYGIAWANVQPGQDKDITLQAVEDHPVHIKVLDTEGQAVHSPTVFAHTVMSSSSGSLDQFLTAWDREWQSATTEAHLDQRLVGEVTQVLDVRQLGQGIVEIHGIGKERYFHVEIGGRRIARSELRVVNRAGFDATPLNRSILEKTPQEMRWPGMPRQLQGPDILLVAEPAKAIEGVVKTADTQEPVAEAVVMASTTFDVSLSTRTDQFGRFHIDGLPHVKEYFLRCTPPGETPYLSPLVVVPGTVSLETLQANIELRKGVVLTGRIVEAQTGVPVRGGIRFIPLPENKFFAEPGYDSYRRDRVMNSNEPDGSFRLVTVPGPGVLVAQCRSSDIMLGSVAVTPFRLASLTAEEGQRVKLTGSGNERYFTSADGSIESLSLQNVAKVIEGGQPGESVQCDLSVDSGKTLDLVLSGPSGDDIAGAFVAGVTESWPTTYEVPDSKCTLYGLHSKERRRVIVLHPNLKLAGAMTAAGSDSSPARLQLQPTAVITGRVVDASGESIANADINISPRDDTARELYRQVAQRQKPMQTDADGKFQIDHIVPKMNFGLTFQRGSERFTVEKQTVYSIPSGEVRELGDVIVRRQ